MHAELDIRKVAAGETFERDFIGECEIVVKREGLSRARHEFLACGRTIGRLRWRGLRRAVYEGEGGRFDIAVAALDRRIRVIAEDGGESCLVMRSCANPRSEKLRAEMAEGDNFCIVRYCDSRLRSATSLVVHKQFYKSTLLVFRFHPVRRTQTTVHIEVTPMMKWEARFLHRLLVLIVCKIILERRHSGSQPCRTKELPRSYGGRRIPRRKSTRI